MTKNNTAHITSFCGHFIYIKKITQTIYWGIINKELVVDAGKLIMENQLKYEIVDWQNIRIYPFLLTPLTKLRYFQYRLMSSKLITNYHINKWDKTVSQQCYRCTEIATTFHVLYECSIINHLWKAMAKRLSYMLNNKIILSLKTVILNDYKGIHKELVNIIILITKQFIYAQYCLKESINFMGTLKRINDYRRLETISYHKLQTKDKYQKKWELLN